MKKVADNPTALMFLAMVGGFVLHLIFYPWLQKHARHPLLYQEGIGVLSAGPIVHVLVHRHGVPAIIAVFSAFPAVGAGALAGLWFTERKRGR